MTDLLNHSISEDKTEETCHLNDETPWKLIELYFGDDYLSKLVRHQLESYNNLIEYQLIKTIQMFNKHEHITSQKEYNPIYKKNNIEVYITFENLQIEAPQISEINGVKNNLLPNKARLRNFNYSSTMFLDIYVQTIVRNGPTLENMQIFNKIIPKVNIGKMPIMLKSNICILNSYKHISHELLGECKCDPGGYFIIKGSEKTILGQERAAENKIYVYPVKNNSKYLWQAELKSVPDFKCISPKQINMMICSNNKIENIIVIQIPRIKQPIPIFILFRALDVLSDKDICSYILLDTEKYLDNVNEKKNEILEILRSCIIDAEKYLTKESCIKYITNNVMYTSVNVDKDIAMKKKTDFTFDVLTNDLFPHCATKIQKVYYLGYMVKKLLFVSNGILMYDDRDSYTNKRIDLAGTLINNLFRNYFNKFVKDMQRQIIKEIDFGPWRTTEDYDNIINNTNLYKIFKPSTIENGIKRALSTGDFSIKNGNNNNNKVGVGQVLNRLNYTSGLSHLRRIATPVDKNGKLIGPRKLHNTTWGYLCPAETPEGASVGIVKNLSYMTHITIPSDSTPIHDYFHYLSEQTQKHSISTLFLDKSESKLDFIVLTENTEDFYDKVKIVVNGTWIGITNSPMELYNDLKNQKYNGMFNIYTSIVFDYVMKEIIICNNGGRLTRPLLKINPITRLPFYNQSIMNKIDEKQIIWEGLLIGQMNDNNHINHTNNIQNSIIEYIDPDEQNNSLIAMNVSDLQNDKNTLKSYTHCEIHSSTIFGVLASCIPFPERNQSPRNTYQSAQAKQAIGVYATNFYDRLDKTSYILNYLQRPLIETRFMNFIKLDKVPCGYNIKVAIMTHTGYNQEDSILINKGSIDRGLFMASIFHTEKDEDNKQNINGNEEIRCQPNPAITKKMKIGNYSKINKYGFVPENVLVENSDVIIAKVTPIKSNRNKLNEKIKYEDQSKIYRTFEETYVDKNYMNKNGDGYNFAKIRLRITRKPTIGDKFASRSGQKGTVGLVINEEDMPFNEDGVRPDIIINPHAIPSRMTIAQLTEMILTKLLIELGLFGDGSSFTSLSVNDISKKLAELGKETYGNEILYNPQTGQQHNCNVFMGIAYYQRLKHMVNDKIHSRANGPMVNLTRQPMEGRTREGGLRFGEMERDASIAHGMSRFTRERLYESSDKYEIYVCKLCGIKAICNKKENIYACNMCENSTDFRKIEIPYACNLLNQELETMNIAMRFITEN